MPSIAEWESVFQSSSKLIQVFKYINIILFSKSERSYKVVNLRQYIKNNLFVIGWRRYIKIRRKSFQIIQRLNGF